MAHLVNILGSFLLLLSFSSAAFALPALVKLDEKAANGDCLPTVDKFQANELIDKYNIKFSGSTGPTDKMAVARVLASIEDLSGGKCQLPRDAAFAFRVDNKGISRYDGKHIQINAGAQNEKALREENKGSGGCNNTGLIAHELCHRIGSQTLSGGRGITAYEFYRNRVPDECGLTKYAIHNKNENPRNEEFAEVCSAFITNPEILVNNKSKSCEKAMEAFKELIGDQSRSTKCEQKKIRLHYDWNTRPNRPDSGSER